MSRPDIPITTSDGVVLYEGDRAYNYYDMQPGVIRRVDSSPQPDTMKGQDSNTPIAEWSNYWFDFQQDDDTRSFLDGSRICSQAYAIRRGWTNP